MEITLRPFGDLRFVVSGTVRGGTHYIANVLKDLGFNVAHEGFHPTVPKFKIRKGKAFVQTYEGEVSGYNGFMLDELYAFNIPIFHLWRHPVHHVNSVLRRWGGLDGGEWDAASIAKEWMKTHQHVLKFFPARIALESPLPGLIKLYETVRGGRPNRDFVFEILEKHKTEEGMCANGKDLQPSPKEITWLGLPPEVEEFARKVGGYVE